MADKSANIAIKINGDSKALQSDLKKAKASLAEFGLQAKKSIAKMAKLAAAAAAAAAAIGVALFKSSVESAKEIQNLSRVAGVSAEKFQKLAFAAKDYGIEQDKLSDILKDTNDKVGDFLVTGGGALVDYFENIAPKIGQTAEEFKNLSSDQVLQKYVNGLEKANVSQAEMTFYMEAIASDATALLPLLKDNGKGFEDVANQVDKMGIALSDIEVQQLSQISDTFSEMSKTTKMFISKIMVQFAPVIQVIADKYKVLTNSSQDFGQTAVKVFGVVAKAVAHVGNSIAGLKVIINAIKLIFNTMVVGITTAVLKLLELVNKVQQAVVKSQNVLIRGLNKLPKVDIEELIVGDLSAIAKIESFQSAAINVMDDGVDNLHASLMQELPTEMVDSFLAEIKRASESAAKIKVDSSAIVFGDDEEDETLKNTENKYKGYYERMLEAQKSGHEKLLEDTKNYNAEVDKSDTEALERKKRLLSGIQGMFTNLSSLMGSENKKLFNIGKAAALANATIDGIAAAISSFKFGASIGGPILGGAFAAASAVSTGMMLSQIAKQQPSGSAQTPNVSTGNIPSQQSQQNSQPNGTLIVQGLTPEISGIAEQLLDYQRNGGRVVLGG